jgi:hypothetical protein
MAIALFSFSFYQILRSHEFCIDKLVVDEMRVSDLCIVRAPTASIQSLSDELWHLSDNSRSHLWFIEYQTFDVGVRVFEYMDWWEQLAQRGVLIGQTHNLWVGIHPQVGLMAWPDYIRAFNFT